MPDFLLAAGELMHLIGKSENKVIASSPAVDSDFPVSGLYDNFPSIVTRWGSLAAASRHDADLNFAVNGDFELWDGGTPDIPTGWALEGSTTVTKDTTNEIQGTASVRVDGAIYRDYKVPTGALVALRGKFARYTGSGSDAQVQLIDMETGEWLDEEGNWQSSEIDLWAEDTVYPASSAVTRGITATARPYSLVKKDLTTVRLRLICGGEDDGDEGIFDDFSLVIVPNLMTIHGHNVPPKHDPQLSSSSGSGFTSSAVLATMEPDAFTTLGARALGTRNQPSFYYRLQDSCPLFAGAGRISATSGLSGRTDSKQFMVSLRIRSNGVDGVNDRIVQAIGAGSNELFNIIISSDNRIRLQAFDSSGTLAMDLLSSAEALPPDTNEHHVAFSVDTTNNGGSPTRAQLYIDGVTKLGSSSGTVVDATADFSAITAIRFGGKQASATFSGSLNDFYAQPGYSPDLSADITKFRSSSGDRVDLGTDGSTPSGAAAWFYHYGTEAAPVTGFLTNHGDGGGTFSVVGTVGSELMFGAQRYWRLNLAALAPSPADLPAAKPYLGQWVLTRAVAIPRQRNEPHPSPRFRPSLELRSPSGDVSREKLAYSDSRRYSFEFWHGDATERGIWSELRDRYGGGTRPVVIVPDVDKADVHFGYLSIDHDEETLPLEQSQLRIEFEEQPFPEDVTT